MNPICIRVQGDLELQLLPYVDGYLWRIRNCRLERVERIRLQIVRVRTFDSERAAFREGDNPFNGHWSMIPDLPPGEVSADSIFLAFQDRRLRLGRTANSNWLPWPNGDQSANRRWLLELKIRLDSGEWPIYIEVRSTVGTESVEVLDVNAPPPSNDRRMQSTEPVGESRARTKIPEAPKLSESIRRLHVLKWRQLLRDRKFDGEHLRWHESQEKRHAAAKPDYSLLPPPTSGFGVSRTYSIDGKKVWHAEWKEHELAKWKARENDPAVVDTIGISETVALAMARFEGIIEDYLALWAAVNGNSDDFELWMVSIALAVTDEVRDVWKGEWHEEWFERACLKSVSAALDALKEKWKFQVFKLEILHLENPHLSLKSIVAAKGNLKAVDSFEETNKLLESASETLRRWELVSSGAQQKDTIDPASVAGPAATRQLSSPDQGHEQQDVPSPNLQTIASEQEVLATGHTAPHNFTSQTGRESAVKNYVQAWTSADVVCSEASLARTAKVDPADLSKWKSLNLAADSEKGRRIERALTNNEPPTSAPAKPSRF